MNHYAHCRDQSKSPQRHIAHRLTQEAGLNPAQIRVCFDIFADYIDDYLSQIRPPGTIVHTAVSDQEPAGKPIKNCQVVPVALSYFDDADVDVIREQGTVEARVLRLYRLSCQAKEQGGLLSYEDLSILLCVDLSTIKDLVKRLRDRGVQTPTRGAVKDIGPEPTHKRIIANLLGRGFTTTQIRAATSHSEAAIGRYQHQFALVIYLLYQYPDASDDERIQLSNLSPKAYETYVDVYNELQCRSDCHRHLVRLRLRFELDPLNLAGAANPATKAHSNSSRKHLQEQNLATAFRQTIQQDLATTTRVAQAVTEDLMALVDTAFQIPDNLRPGEVIIFVDAHDTEWISGNRAIDRDVIAVTIPVCTEQVLDIWRAQQPVATRRARIATLIASTIWEQGGVISISKLAELLHTGPSTLAKELRDFAIAVHMCAPTKGVIEDAGPTLTHKDWIIDLDQHGLTAEEISWLTRHAPISRDRYIQTYRRAETLMHLEGRIPESEQLARILRIRPHVAKQYVDLLRRYHPDDNPTDENEVTGNGN